MKILFLTYRFYPDVGGIEIHSENLVNYLWKSGAEVHLVTLSERRNKVDLFPFKIIRNPKTKELLREYQWADLIFENNPTLKLSWPLVFMRKPHVITLHTWISRASGKRALQDKLKLLWLKKAAKVIAVSEKLKEGTFGNAVVIKNSYNEELFKQLKSIEKKKEFVFLGRLVSDKGADMAIELLDRLRSANKEKKGFRMYVLTIIGKGPEESRLKDLVRKYGLEKSVQFKGQLSGKELVECLNEHRYILIPSRWKEPFGIVALEGMATGCLPIVSNGGGLPEAVGEVGVVFERNDIKSLVQQVTRLLEDPNLEKTLRKKINDHLQSHTTEAVSQQYYNIVSQAVQTNGRTRNHIITSHRKC